MQLRKFGFADYSCKENGRDYRMCREVQFLRQQLVEQEEKFEEKLNKSTNAREQEQDLLHLRLNHTKFELHQLVEATNKALNEKREKLSISLDKTSTRLQRQEEEVSKLTQVFRLKICMPV